MVEAVIKRRLAAILAADVAGYTRLMQVDEAATVAALDAARLIFREQIEAEGGRVVDMAGDSVLAVFETVTGAVSTALAAQKAFAATEVDLPEDRRMRFRIGVHLGDVMEKPDGSIYGDGVNLAARLEGLSAPGGVCISAAVSEQISGKLDETFDDIGEHSVKNFAKPVHAFAWGQGPSAATPTAASPTRVELKPTVAIGEFGVTGGDSAESLAAGVLDAVKAALSNQTGLTMVSEGTGADYLASGRIQALNDRYRATLHLAVANGGETFASERFDGDLDDPFQAEDDLASLLYNAIRFGIYDRVAGMATQRDDAELETEALLAKAAKLLFQDQVPNFERAGHILTSIVATEPENFMALSMKAATHITETIAGYRALSPDDRAAALNAAREAVRLNSSSDFAHYVLSIVHLHCQADYVAARREADRSLEINPYYTLAKMALGEALICNGEVDDGTALCMQTAKALSRGAGNHRPMRFVALGEFVRGNYKAAIDWAVRSDQRQADVARTLLILAAAAGLGDEPETARRTAERMLARHPEFRIRDFGNWPFRNPEPGERLIEGLRLAGLPE